MKFRPEIVLFVFAKHPQGVKSLASLGFLDFNSQFSDWAKPEATWMDDPRLAQMPGT